MGKYFYTLASHFFPAFSLLHSLSLCPAPPPLPPLVLSCFAFIFINSFHNIYFISNISFAKRKKNADTEKKRKNERKKSWAKNGKADVFLFTFYSLRSILFLFTDAFVFASFSYCFFMCVCVFRFFLAAALLSFISVPFHAWFIV